MHYLIAFCLNDACRHQALIDVRAKPDAGTTYSLARSATNSLCRCVLVFPKTALS